MTTESRYQRQIALPQIGIEGQERLRAARVLVLGCGALGTVIAETLTRAGVGLLRLVDRDFVEWTNLQRQVLFTEADAATPTPKATAAARHLEAINSEVRLDPVVAHADARNIRELADGIDLILDGADNFALRYLVNDYAVAHAVPWIYGACLATEGRVMAVVPGDTPCLRCLFPDLPNAGSLETCDTAGIIAPTVNIVASLQAAAALRLLVGEPPAAALITLDLWPPRFKTLDLSATRRADCPCCGRGEYPYLDGVVETLATALCGRNAVQVLPPKGLRLDLAELAQRLKALGSVEQSPLLLRTTIQEHVLTVFRDGRAVVQGTEDEAEARVLYDRYIGS